MIKDPSLILTQRNQILVPIKFSIMGDIDKVEFIDE